MRKRMFSWTGKEVVLSFQHMFAMLGATILVPMLANLSISITLISAGLGTIIFYFLTKRKVPVFLGSSFAFLPALIAVVGQNVEQFSREWNQRVLAACLSLVLAGLVYVVLAVIIKKVGVAKVKKLFPPVVVGPVIIVIGMVLAPKIFYNNIVLQYTALGSAAWKEWTTAILTALVIICVNAFAKPKSFLKIIPILLGFIAGYIYAAIIGLVSFEGFDWTDIVIFQHLHKELGFYGAFGYMDWSLFATAAAMIVPIAIVTFMEHLGDISANSIVCGKDFMVEPGLHRTLLGDGIATATAGLLGAPANTTYGENTAVLAMTKNYETKNIFLAACMAIGFGVFSIFGNLLSTIPASVIGGVSIVLFGMIAASGLRALVDGKVDFNITKNVIIVSVVLSIGLGLSAMSLAGDVVSNLGLDGNMFKIMIGKVEISPLALATIVGILLNIIIPGKEKEDGVRFVDPEFDNQEKLEGKDESKESIQSEKSAEEDNSAAAVQDSNENT